ncbi:MAG: AI-2E family transporter [Caulobacteraceae bacterium]
MIAAPPTLNSSVRAVLVAAAVVAAGLILVRLADVVLMAFGAVLAAVLLDAVARPLGRLTRLARGPALTLAVLLIAVCSGAILWLFGSQAVAQLGYLSELLPKAWASLRAPLANNPLGRMLLAEIDHGRPQAWLVGLGPKAVGSVTAFAAGGVIVAFAGLYLAAHPRSYLDGVLKLTPPAARERVAEVLQACHQALRQWLVGQLISIFLVGSTVAFGLWLSGVPSPIALGVIAGLAQFVPVVGPMAATLPGLLAAAGAGWQPLAWAAATYLAASQFEANVITPMILRRMVQLPMAVTLFAVLAAGVLLGPLGVLFATPLAVVAHVVLDRTYIERLNGPPDAETRVLAGDAGS